MDCGCHSTYFKGYEMIFIDFETRSTLSVKDVGSTYYTRHESTFPLCMAYAIDDKPVEIITDFSIDGYGLFDFGNEFIVAHNVGFEKSIIQYCLPYWILPTKWIDTSAMCRLAGLPGGLGEAAKILGLIEQKDPKGKALVKSLCMPRKGKFSNDPALFEQLYTYCMQDVETMRALYYALPKFTKSEYKIWTYNREMNERGIKIDRELLNASIRMAETAKAEAVVELTGITHGQITAPSQSKRIADYCCLESVTANAITDVIDSPDLNETQRRVLEIRQLLGKSSIAKLESAIVRLCEDDRIRDLLIYHGASTGRETGSGFQPLNLPRGKVRPKDDKREIDLIINELCQAILFNDVELLSNRYKSVLNAISYCLRSLIIPENDCRFLCADLNAIEARLVFWFAGEEKALQAFRNGSDIYRIMASLIYNKPIRDINDAERFTGKNAVLGLGYSMGVDKFAATCAGYNAPVSQAVAQKAVTAYRNTYSRVKNYWYAIERAAKACVSGNRTTRAGRIGYEMEHKGVLKWLCAVLPSGRKLRYFDPSIDSDGQLVYKGIEKGHFTRLHTYSGKLLENVVQATSRDLLWFLVEQLKAANYNPVLTIYDEILCEDSGGTLDEMREIMNRVPEYLEGLPTATSGWEGTRYRKG
jgi:DNA polymerase